ncbi:hypothetical protein [Allosphingosinicella sp.]|uniref:hypothetical protein n=1 Tax=Allosphingosinicella sp. TaxID=2823234 RepID=UPI003784484E
MFLSIGRIRPDSSLLRGHDGDTRAGIRRLAVDNQQFHPDVSVEHRLGDAPNEKTAHCNENYSSNRKDQDHQTRKVGTDLEAE